MTYSDGFSPRLLAAFLMASQASEPMCIDFPADFWRLSRSIYACTASNIYRCKDNPDAAAAARIRAPSSFGGRMVILSCLRLYSIFARFLASLIGIYTTPETIISYAKMHVNVQNELKRTSTFMQFANRQTDRLRV